MTGTSFTLLGLGSMGQALAGTALDAGHSVTVWNRTPGRADALSTRGAIEAVTARQALFSSDVIVVCLYDHASVHQVLDAEPSALDGKALINLTTTTPADARGLATWAKARGAAYLDGAIMVTPDMIGQRQGVILYSGSKVVVDTQRPLLDTWGSTTYEGNDAGLASLWDLAMLSGMYSMFSGFLHGVAMLQSASVSAESYARRAAPFLRAMTDLLGHSTEHLDNRDYSRPTQSLAWTTKLLKTVERASREQGITPDPVEMVQHLIQQQIDGGYGNEDFDRIIESMR